MKSTSKNIVAGVVFAFAATCIFAKSKKPKAPELPPPVSVSIEKQKTPIWTGDAGRLKLFPREDYISALGIGFSIDNAKSKASNGIASFIKTEIKSLTESRYSENEKNGIVEEKKSIDEEIILQTNEKLYTMDYTEVWKDDETSQYYCVAFIEKKAAWEQLIPKLDKIAATVEKKIETAESDTTGFWRTLTLGSVLNERTDFYAFYDFAVLVNPTGAKKYIPVEKRFLEVAKTIQDEKSKQTVWLTVNNDKNGMVYRATASTLEKSGFTVSQNRGKFVATADITISIRKENDAYVSYPGITLEVKNAFGTQVASFSNTAKKTVDFEKAALEEKAYRTLEKAVEELLKK